MTFANQDSFNDTFMTVERKNNGEPSRIIFDKMMIPFDKDLNESSGGS